jgi:hypothetical protein
MRIAFPFLCACCFFCFSATSQRVLGFAPGELNFANRSIVSNIDAPVSDVTGKHVGAGYTAQLYGRAFASPAIPFDPLFPKTSFILDDSGYIMPTVVSVPFLSPPEPGFFVMRVYNGLDWESSTIRGESGVLRLGTGGGGIIPPTDLIGLQPFQVMAVPEPSSVMVGCLGAVVLWVASWQRKQYRECRIQSETGRYQQSETK